MQLSRKGELVKHFFRLFFLGCSTLLFAAPSVSVSLLPQKYFVEHIAKDAVHVNVMVPSGTSPHTYEPKPAQMKALAQSDAYFAIDDSFEKTWLPKFKDLNPKMRIVNTAEGIEKIAMSEHHHEGEAAQAEHDHKEGLDPHIWLDPILVKTQARHIYETLTALYPEHQEAFTQNYRAFLTQIDTLDATIRRNLQTVQHRKFIVFHPSFGYFAKRYDLEQIAIEVSGKEPKPAELAHLIAEAKEEEARVVFVAPQFSQKSAQTIAKQIGGKTLTIDPLSYAWEENLLAIAHTFQTALK
jgi:zinc transport system substrate-binding protein